MEGRNAPALEARGRRSAAGAWAMKSAAPAETMEGRNAPALEARGRRSAAGAWAMKSPAAAETMEGRNAAALETRGRRSAAGTQTRRRRAAENMARSAGAPNAMGAMASDENNRRPSRSSHRPPNQNRSATRRRTNTSRGPTSPPRTNSNYCRRRNSTEFVRPAYRNSQWRKRASGMIANARVRAVCDGQKHNRHDCNSG